jgi:hypothetical protein
MDGLSNRQLLGMEQAVMVSEVRLLLALLVHREL